jgi:hypothetical protein
MRKIIWSVESELDYFENDSWYFPSVVSFGTGIGATGGISGGKGNTYSGWWNH